MTNWLPALAIALTILAVGASAHGAPEARDIDTRLAADSTDLGDYGASGVADGGAWDLLALDYRFANYPGINPDPAVVFRIVAQSDGSPDGRTITLEFVSRGTPFTIEISPDAEVKNGDGLRVEGPTPVGDGHPQAWDLWLPYSLLGLQSGAILENITLTSKVAGDDHDILPGGWYSNGVEVALPIPPEPLNLSLAEPAKYLELSVDGASQGLDGRMEFLANVTGGSRIEFTIINSVDLPQFVYLVDGGGPLLIEGLSSGINLPALESRAQNFTAMRQDGQGGSNTIVAWSELGGFETFQVTMVPPTLVPSGDEKCQYGKPDANGVCRDEANQDVCWDGSMAAGETCPEPPRCDPSGKNGTATLPCVTDDGNWCPEGCEALIDSEEAPNLPAIAIVGVLVAGAIWRRRQ